MYEHLHPALRPVQRQPIDGSAPPYTASPARYSKGNLAVRVQSNGSMMMGRIERLLRALNGRWTNRERAYIISPSKFRKFEALWESGADASLDFAGNLYAPRYVLDTKK